MNRYLKLATNLNTTYLSGCCLFILSGDCLHLWLLGALVYLNVFVLDTVENSWGVNWIPRYFTRNIQSFSLSSIYVVFDIDKTVTMALKLATSWKNTYLLGCWLHILSVGGLHLWLLSALVYLSFFRIYTIEKSCGVNWILRYFTRIIESFGLSLICVVWNINETQRIQHQFSILKMSGC